MAVVPSTHAHAPRRGLATAPSVRGSFGNAGAAASLAATLPAGIVNGDIGLVVATVDPAIALNTPSGWTLVTSMREAPGGSTITYLFRRTMVSTDSSTTFTLAAASGTPPMAFGGVIIQGAAGFGVGCTLGRNVTQTMPAGGQVAFPAIKPGPRDLVIAFGAARNTISLALNASQMATQPSGFTIRQNRSAANTPGLSVAYGCWIMDGPASSAAGVSLTGTLNDQSYRMGGLLSLTPTGRRLTNALPASLTNAALHGYGTSYLGYAANGVQHASEVHFYDRIKTALGTPSAENNLGTPGAMATDVCGFAFGNYAANTRSPSTDTPYTLSQAGNWMSQTGRSGLILLDLFGNDAINHAATANGGTTAKSLAGARSAGEALVRLLRASSMVEETDASCVFTGTWSNVSSTDYSGGAVKGTTTPGDKVTITTTQTDIDAIIFAIDDSALGQVGASYSVKVNGSTVATGTTSNQMRKSSSTVYKQSSYCQLAIPLRNLGGGSKTIEITHTGSSGQGLYFDGYLIPNPTPPIIVLNSLATYSPTALAALTPASSNAIFALYSQIARDIAALFPDGRVIVFDPLESGLWDYTTMVTTYDNIHLNDAGSAHYATGILKVLSERVA